MENQNTAMPSENNINVCISIYKHYMKIIFKTGSVEKHL